MKTNDCHCSDVVPAPESKKSLKSAFNRCVSCACSCAGASGTAFLLGHAGCIITPLAIAAAGLTTATAGVSALALAFGAAATVGGLYLWDRLRGKQASSLERKIVFGSAALGLVMSVALHFNRAHNHGMKPEAVPCPPPSSAFQDVNLNKTSLASRPDVYQMRFSCGHLN